MIYSATLPAQAAGATTDAVTVLGVYSQTFYSGDTVTDIELVAPYGYTPVTFAATNSVTIAVRQLRAGQPPTVFGSISSGAGQSINAETPISIPITQQPILQNGDVIDVVMHQSGSGQAIAAGLMLAVYVS